MPRVLAALAVGLLGGYLLGLLRNRAGERPAYLPPQVSDDRFVRA